MVVAPALDPADELADLNGKTGLLGHLACDGLLQRLAALDVTARERPQTFAWRPETLNHEQLVGHHDHGADCENRGSSFKHRRARGSSASR